MPALAQRVGGAEIGAGVRDLDADAPVLHRRRHPAQARGRDHEILEREVDGVDAALVEGVVGVERLHDQPPQRDRRQVRHDADPGKRHDFSSSAGKSGIAATVRQRDAAYRICAPRSRRSIMSRSRRSIQDGDRTHVACCDRS